MVMLYIVQQGELNKYTYTYAYFQLNLDCSVLYFPDLPILPKHDEFIRSLSI